MGKLLMVFSSNVQKWFCPRALIFAWCLLTATVFYGQSDGSKEVVIEWQFKHVRHGFSYTHFLEVIVDGDTLPKTPFMHQDEVAKCAFQLDSLPHNWKISVVAIYKNQPVYYTKENDFQIDAVVQLEQLKIQDPTCIHLCLI
jgi:hypothetical protein